MFTSRLSELGRDRVRVISVAVMCCLVVLALVGYHFLSLSPTSDPGASITAGQSSDADIQNRLDQEVEASRMTISVSPAPRLRGGQARVNVVNPDTNKFDQSFTLNQDGKVIYSSGVVKPGQSVEWCDADGAHAGDATITVQALDPSSDDPSGNPQSVSVVLTDAS